MKIANKTGISFFAVTAICSLAAASFLYFIARSDLQRSIKANLESTARSRAAHIETYLGMLKTSVRQLSKSPTLDDLLKIAGKDNLQQGKEFEQATTRLRRTKEANPSLYEFLLLDKTGRVIASSNEKNIGADKSADAYFLGAQRDVFIKDAYYLESIKEPLLAVSAPLADSQTGELRGVLVARVKLDELWNITTDRTGLRETGEFYIVNKHGLMITPSLFLKDTFLKQAVDTEGIRQARLHKDRNHVLPENKRVLLYPNYRGVQAMGSHEFIPQMRWAVLAEIDAKEAFAPLVKLRLILLATLFFAILVALLLSWRLARYITGPIKKLHKGTLIIGSGNFDYKVGTDANDEVGQLARAFDAMTENLKTTTTSVENLNKEIAERKRTAEKLSARTAELFEREEDLTITLRSIGDAMIATDKESRVTRMNPAAEHLTGWSLSEAAGKPLEDIFRIINAQTHEPVQNPIVKVLETGQVVGLANHTALVARDGTVRQIADSAAPIRDADGRIRGVVLIFHDVTAEYQIREALKKSQAILASKTTLLETQLETSIDGILAVDNEGHTILFNKRFGELWRIPRQILDSKNDQKMLEYVFCQLKDPAEFGRKLTYLYEHQDEKSRDEIDFADGRVFDRYSAPLIGADGKHFGRTWFFHDITERKRAEEEIRQAKDDWESTFNSVPDLICLIDANHTITRVNRAMANLLGIKPEEAIGRKCYTCIHNTSQPPDFCPHVQLLNDGKEHQTEIKDENLGKWLNVTVSPLRNGAGEITGAIHVARDITERKETEQTVIQAKTDLEQAYQRLQESFELESMLTVQAQAASAAKSQFVANISHEIRTPLNGVIGICELLLETKMTAEQVEYAQTINSSAEALLNIINATLDFAKIEAGKMDLEIIDFNLGDIMEDITGILAVNAAKKKLELVNFIEPHVPLNLNGDPGRLRQVLINLIGNAIKFTYAGKIEVKVEVVDEKCSVFGDQGSGRREEGSEKVAGQPEHRTPNTEHRALSRFFRFPALFGARHRHWHSGRQSQPAF